MKKASYAFGGTPQSRGQRGQEPPVRQPDRGTGQPDGRQRLAGRLEQLRLATDGSPMMSISHW